jgi:hypothetical protein
LRSWQGIHADLLLQITKVLFCGMVNVTLSGCSSLPVNTLQALAVVMFSEGNLFAQNSN